MTPTDAQKNREIAEWCEHGKHNWATQSGNPEYEINLNMLFAPGGPIEKLEQEEGVSFVERLIVKAYLDSTFKGEPTFATALRDAVHKVIPKKEK